MPAIRWPQVWVSLGEIAAGTLMGCLALSILFLLARGMAEADLDDREARNRRPVRLFNKKYFGAGLAPEESAELDRLNAEMLAELKPADASALEEFVDYVAEVRAEALARRRQKVAADDL